MPCSATRSRRVLDEVDALGAAADAAAGTRAVYLDFLQRFPDHFATAIRVVARAPEGGVLVHCQVGKDRTGLVTALLLRLAGRPVARSSPTTRSAPTTSRPLLAVSRGCGRRGRARAPRPPRPDRPPTRCGACSPSSRSGMGASRAISRRRVCSRPELAAARARLRGLMPVLALFGPTASGKTAVAEAIAALEPAELISADSMQVYRGLPLLTNQARGSRLVGIWPLSHEASVAEYAELAHAEIDGALAAGRLPVVVGGTGFYLRAALAELDVPPRARGRRP